MDRARRDDTGPHALGDSLRRIRALRWTLRWIRRTPDLPRDLALELALAVYREALVGLYGLQGRAFDAEAPTPDGVEGLERGDLERYQRLRESLSDARAAARGGSGTTWTGQDRALVAELLDFLQRLEAHARRRLTSPRERARARRARWVGAVIAAALLLFAIVGVYLHTRPWTSTVDPQRITRPGGIHVTFFAGQRFEREVLRRVDPRIDLFAARSPARGVPADRFSVRWDGYLQAPTSGTRYLCLVSDDGGRVYLNGRLLLNDWTVHPLHRACRKVRLGRGWFPLRVELFDLGGGATAKLLWGPSKKKLVVVPSAHLCCRD